MIWLLLDSSSLGGIERHVATLCAGLRDNDIEASIVLYQDHGANPWLQQIASAQLPVRILAGGARALLREMAQERPALVHTHGYKASIVGRLAATALGIPCVTTFHAGERAPFPVSLYQSIDIWSSFLGQRIAVSDPIRRQLPFASDLVRNFLSVPASPPTDVLPRRIGFVGRLSHEKAPDRFCELARNHAGLAQWHMWGDGPMRQALEREYADHVTFHGLVTDLAPVWPTIGLLAMPSRAEGLPMAALEALAAGVPILATAVGDVPKVVIDGRTGWLCGEDWQQDAARALQCWATLPEQAQRQLRRSCWQHVRNEYSQEQQLPLILSVYARAGYHPAPDLIPAE